jgi:hypothetical protein
MAAKCVRITCQSAWFFHSAKRRHAYGQSVEVVVDTKTGGIMDLSLGE